MRALLVWISAVGFPLMCLLGATTPASADSATGYEPQAEVYTEHGETNGCGLSFIVVWVGDGKHQMAVSGSANFFLTVGGGPQLVTIIKAGGMYDLLKTPVTYAWIETSSYGKTSGFTVRSGEDPGTFIAGKNGDPRGFALPLAMATTGFFVRGVLRAAADRQRR